MVINPLLGRHDLIATPLEMGWGFPHPHWGPKISGQRILEKIIRVRVRWNIANLLLELTFRPSGAPEHWKIHCFATFLPFRAPSSSFFWLFLFSDLISSSLLFSSLTALTPTASFVHIRKAILNGVANPIIKLHSHLGMVSAAFHLIPFLVIHGHDIGDG